MRTRTIILIAGLLLVVAAAGTGLWYYAAHREVPTVAGLVYLDAPARQFAEAFDADRGVPRLVLLASPA